MCLLCCAILAALCSVQFDVLFDFLLCWNFTSISLSPISFEETGGVAPTGKRLSCGVVETRCFLSASIECECVMNKHCPHRMHCSRNNTVWCQHPVSHTSRHVCDQRYPSGLMGCVSCVLPELLPPPQHKGVAQSVESGAGMGHAMRSTQVPILKAVN